jgi:F-box-like
VKRIDVLPDDVLLDVFDFYVDMSLSSYFGRCGIEAWQSLVHVCRRWRGLVLGSPRRLNLQLYCTPKTPARDTLDVWPTLPLIIQGYITSTSGTPDNIIAALGQSNRVCKVDLCQWDFANWRLEEVLAPMQVPFPELTYLQLFVKALPVIPVPDSFLGGSAPRLRHFGLLGIPFPGLLELLLSATHLVRLHLCDIPDSGYISSEAMLALLSVLTSLEELYLQFRSPRLPPDRESQSLPPPNRSILPALGQFRFSGVTKYLEELVTRIDTPQLNALRITFLEEIDFDCPRLAQFINCTPKLRALDEAHLQFHDSTASVALQYRTSEFGFKNLVIDISCREPDRQLSSIEQICNFSFHPISTVEDLYIEHLYLKRDCEIDAIESTLWLQILLPFTAVKNLYLFNGFALGIAAALQELVGGRITEVLPSLRNIFVQWLEPSGPVQENIGQFVAARQRSGHPITISVWKN